MHPSRIHNFSAGPSVLPLKVLEQSRDELLSYQGKGYSIGEISHRSAVFQALLDDTKERLNELLSLNNEFHILFLQGGATTQFAQWVLNFASNKTAIGLASTGVWSEKAWSYLKPQQPGAIKVYDGSINRFKSIPEQLDWTYSPLDILHFTSNNTIYGTQFQKEPLMDGAWLVCDASSDILSRPIDAQRYGIIYAGAQKNVGPAGVTILLINKHFLDKFHNQKAIPPIWDYRSHLNTLFNTPPTFGIYQTHLVLKWLQQDMGGLAKVQQANQAKAQILYQEIDQDDFYEGYAAAECRSLMNVSFNIGPAKERERLESAFIQQAEQEGMIGLKGHRALGGIRASVYNACPVESVEALQQFMHQFKCKMG